MTKICYDRGALRLTMEGHAGAGEKGKDPICAALSMLMMTLERRMEECAEAALPAVCRAPGSFALQCWPEEEAQARCRESFDTVFAGLALLAEQEPEHVSVRLEDDREECGE